MKLMIDSGEIYSVLEKQASVAVAYGKNRAYGKGMRDAYKVVIDNAVSREEGVRVRVGGVPRQGTWWYECGRCGTAINPGDDFCRHCGVPTYFPEEEET